METQHDDVDVVDRIGELPEVAEVLAQFVRIVDPPNRRRKWTTSRVGVLADGTPESILQVLGRERYGSLDLREYMVYWIDGCWENETWENVGITVKAKGTRQVRNGIGVPSGTPEYWKRYREINKARVKAFQAKSREKMRIRIELVRAEQEQVMREALAHQLGVDPASLAPSIGSNPLASVRSEPGDLNPVNVEELFPDPTSLEIEDYIASTPETVVELISSGISPTRDSEFIAPSICSIGEHGINEQNDTLLTELFGGSGEAGDRVVYIEGASGKHGN